MKNGIIGVLLVIVCWLSYRDIHRRDGRLPSDAVFFDSEKREVQLPSSLPTATDIRTKPAITEAASNNKQAIPQRARAIARQEILKSVALQYSRFFAKSNLSKEKTDLVLELLVDRWMVGLEPEVQEAGTDPLNNTKNDRLIEDLVGREGLTQLEAARSNYMADQAAQDAIEGIFGAPLSEPQNSLVSASLKGYRPDQGLGDLMSSHAPITNDVEASLRSQYADRESTVAKSLEGSLTNADLAKFKSWSDAEFEKQLAFLKMIHSANEKS